jgi:hypothetical protein
MLSKSGLMNKHIVKHNISCDSIKTKVSKVSRSNFAMLHFWYAVPVQVWTNTQTNSIVKHSKGIFGRFSAGQQTLETTEQLHQNGQDEMKRGKHIVIREAAPVQCAHQEERGAAASHLFESFFPPTGKNGIGDIGDESLSNTGTVSIHKPFDSVLKASVKVYQ